MEDRMRISQLPSGISLSRRDPSGMPRFFFHLKRGQVTILDQEGLELADIVAATQEAARRGREIAIRDALPGIVSGAVIVIADEKWLPVFEVPTNDV
jgi:uncharacterized protein DUF6894